NFHSEQSSRLLTVAIIVCSVCGFSVSRFVNFLFLVSDMVKSATRGKFYSWVGRVGTAACTWQQVERENDIEKRIWQRRRRKRSERERRERVTKKAGVVKKVDTAE
ncbi:hypothetical protein TNCV_3977531, partial [Trichonephila clavipes]